MNIKVIKSAQQGFTEGKSCLTNLISFHSEMTDLVDKETTVGIFCLDFSKVFDAVSHNMFKKKLMNYELD